VRAVVAFLAAGTGAFRAAGAGLAGRGAFFFPPGFGFRGGMGNTLMDCTARNKE